MKKKKMNLSDLRVESFVTTLAENNIRGGSPGQQFTQACPETIAICPHLTLVNCTFNPADCGVM